MYTLFLGPGMFDIFRGLTTTIHILSAIEYDTQGNFAKAQRNVLNQI